MDSRFAMSDDTCGCPLNYLHLRRQNITALCTTAGENLTAVSGGHSLTETVNLGSVATAGLIGTLHVVYTSCQITYAQQPEGRSRT